MTGQQLLDFADRVAAALGAAGLTRLPKTTKKKVLLALLVEADLPAADLLAIEALPELAPKLLARVEEAEQLHTPLLRDTALGRTAANELRANNTYNMFFSLLRFRVVAGPSKPGPKPTPADAWWGQWRAWMAGAGAVLKASAIGGRAGLTKPQVSDLLAGRNTTAATAERKQALQKACADLLEEASSTLPRA